MTYTLEVDFDVYRSIFSRRASESVTENDVLRELLGLSPKEVQANAAEAADSQPTPTADDSSPGDWLVKNVRFPVGTDFRAVYKGRTYTARVQGGSLVVDGESFDTPSAAAMSITGNAVNGWRFWECRLPGKPHWQLIAGLRR